MIPRPICHSCAPKLLRVLHILLKVGKDIKWPVWGSDIGPKYSIDSRAILRRSEHDGQTQKVAIIAHRLT
jgi:hypothetical protein